VDELVRERRHRGVRRSLGRVRASSFFLAAILLVSLVIQVVIYLRAGTSQRTLLTGADLLVSSAAFVAWALHHANVARHLSSLSWFHLLLQGHAHADSVSPYAEMEDQPIPVSAPA
jgi:hypothetical protein